MDSALLTTSVAFLQLRYEAKPSLWTRLVEAAEAVQNQANGELALPLWNPGPDGHLLRDATRKTLWSFVLQHVFVQALGVNRLYENQTQLIELVRVALDKIRPEPVVRAGFQIQTFVNLDMKFPELVENLYGTLLPEKSDLEFIGGDLYDGVAQYDGKIGSLQFQLIATPKDNEQMKTTLLSMPNLDLFQKDKFTTELHDFWMSADRPSLLISLDVFDLNIDRKKVPAFVQQAMSVASDMIERTVKKFLSMPVKLGGR